MGSSTPSATPRGFAEPRQRTDWLGGLAEGVGVPFGEMAESLIVRGDDGGWFV